MWKRQEQDEHQPLQPTAQESHINTRHSMPETNVPGFNRSLEIDLPKEVPPPPVLSKDACVTPRGMREFLKLSRSSTDDVIRMMLNNVLNHHEQNSNSIFRFHRVKDPQTQCNELLQAVIFPQWAARVKSIEFCSGVYTSMEADIKQEQQEKLSPEEINKLTRIDPYGLRDIRRKLEDKTRDIETLKSWLRNESNIESIVQDRSAEVVKDMCNLSGDFSVTSEFVKYMQSI